MSKKRAEPTAPAATAPVSFEEALRRLEEIVSQLEHGEAPLEAALALYEEGVHLAGFCSGQVREAERRVMLLEEKNGDLVSRPFARRGQDPGPDADDGDDGEEDETDEGEEADAEAGQAEGQSQERLF